MVRVLVIEGVDITHARLVDLTTLADQAKPFYDWVEDRFQKTLSTEASLDQILQTSKEDEIKRAIKECYTAERKEGLPLLFDGVGRSYPHHKASYYFFSWLIRDAPQQRLAPLIRRIIQSSSKNRLEVEVETLSALICEYRPNVKTFCWEALREIIIDRLEGSRRSIKGSEKEIIVRQALLLAIQSYYQRYSNYGSFARIEIPESQVTIGNETFDVSVNLLDKEDAFAHRILVAIKTRETEGGGHSHLFTRDIMSAIQTMKFDNPQDYFVAIIVAQNWAPRELETIRAVVDHCITFTMSPNNFSSFDEVTQKSLNDFVAEVLSGKLRPKQFTNQEVS